MNLRKKTFSDLGLCNILTQTVQQQGYETPSPIQEHAIPPILDGHDVMAAAQTGTGKTAGFSLPILDKLRDKPPIEAHFIRALILVPTRELAAQVHDCIKTYSQGLSISSDVVFGGVNINPQKRRLSKGVDILVATPGRLIDLYKQRQVIFSKLEIFVLDEADRMLDMGFIHDIRKILTKLPKDKQTLMFSATFSKDVRKLAQTIVKNPVEVSVTPENSTVEAIEQVVYPVQQKDKPLLLEALIKEDNWHQVLVFCRTKHGANKLCKVLRSRNIRSEAIHGNKSQGARIKALNSFKHMDIQVLVATDIAARGLDIDKLPFVVNYDLPNVPEDYVHRIGRTGRAGETGLAVSFVSLDEFEYLVSIEKLIGKIIDRQELKGELKPVDLPESSLEKRFFFPKRKQIKRQFRSKNRTQNRGSRQPQQNRGRRGDGEENSGQYRARSRRHGQNQHQKKSNNA